MNQRYDARKKGSESVYQVSSRLNGMEAGDKFSRRASHCTVYKSHQVLMEETLWLEI